jgi:DNA-binding XRE family transcriptional regulator
MGYNTLVPCDVFVEKAQERKRNTFHGEGNQLKEQWDAQLFARRMTKLRNSHKLSLADAAAISGVDRQYIHRIEKGKMQHPSFPLLIQYGTKTYPLSPNELADLADLWENTGQQPRPTFEGLAAEVAEFVKSLPPSEHQPFAILIRALIDQWAVVRGQTSAQPVWPKPDMDELDDPDIPDWLRDKFSNAS